MLQSHENLVRSPLRHVAVWALAAALSACGGGGDGGDTGFVDPLSLVLTRVGPAAVAVDWSDHPLVASFLVRRNGFLLATVATTSLVDASVFINETYCYQVDGLDAGGRLVAATDTGCITIRP